MSFTVGSLFDGSGGFPLAAFMSSGIPKWASEIEPYPIAVTKSRFPHMQHLGSVTDINGAEVEPVDVITFGSPCQDLSVAGKRAGLKHENNGDDETTRSGLFMEAVRIIKQMREATNGVYPRIAVWENVPGAFSSNRGQDFRIVLEELIKICEPKAVMPDVPKKGWPYADSYRGDGWSIAYRVFDAQYWGVPQRRRRIYLVLDLTGGCAREILFERDGLRGYFTEGRAPWKGITPDVERGFGANDTERNCVVNQKNCLTPWDVQSRQIYTTDGPWMTLYAGEGGGRGYAVYTVDQGGGKSGANHYENLSPTLTCTHGGEPAVTYAVATQQGGAEITDNGVCPTITAAAGMSGNNQPWICKPSVYKADDGSTSDVSPTKVGDHNNRVTDHTALVVAPMGLGIQSSAGIGAIGENVMPCLINGDNPGWQNGVFTPITLHGHNISGTLMARDYKGVGRWDTLGSVVCVPKTEAAYWDGTQTTGTLTTRNASGCQRMPDKENFNCVIEKQVTYIVRRLTPIECARLQGFADKWAVPDKKSELTDEEYKFWLNVRNTHAEINGKQVKDYTKQQMLTWYNKLHTDSSEYKLWGNGIALPCALYVMQGIADVLNKN